MRYRFPGRREEGGNLETVWTHGRCVILCASSSSSSALRLRGRLWANNPEGWRAAAGGGRRAPPSGGHWAALSFSSVSFIPVREKRKCLHRNTERIKLSFSVEVDQWKTKTNSCQTWRKKWDQPIPAYKTFLFDTSHYLNLFLLFRCRSNLTTDN